MTRFRVAIAVLIALAVSAVAATRCYEGRIAEYEREVAAAQQQVRADSARISELEAEKDSLVASNDSLVRTLKNRQPEIRERIVRVQEEHPADTPGELARDSVIAELQFTVRGWRTAYDNERKARLLVEEAFQIARRDIETLSETLENRPSARPWYLPRLGVGPAAGICPDGLCVAPVAVQLSWEIRL